MIASRLAGFGTTIFTEMSALAERTGAINLGQGFPDEDGPAAVLEAAQAAMRDGRNQYAPLPGVPALRAAIAEHQQRFYGIELDPASQVQVTMGATEAIAAAILGLCEPGDDVLAFDPYYDSYPAATAMAGARFVPIPLDPPDFTFDDIVVGPKARVILINSPHNPTGRVFSREELQRIADVVIEHDLIAITDEVYEHLVFDGLEHIPLSTLPGMAERTLSISSLGKTFSVTGWKVGWATGPAELVAAVRAAKQFLTFAGATPFQHAGAAALRLDDDWYRAFALELQAKRDHLCDAFSHFTVARPQGTYFANVDVGRDATEFARELPYEAGVVAIPTSVFSATPERLAPYLRFAFCKRLPVIDEAARRLQSLES
ncbi:aminotransferase class I/II-fold pyridoxal phosphate-dependent enzyme [Solirubrobacter sp. CPCC 204708]|uniref:Aminotransferase class I/II-fold pyridoxal phosphate-dependent enzyme n=2 Tax=Solirubrobacter deserti TaxID=2282478 RepID=A0ABT4RUH0_9ACTN|nr:aminotransferase class I/II-fold pyridoxal phosphate-dependent enzyme [Solirubrobacter deserti]MDA0142229.1 aminotransferase class I/II-fold pyridoxal phosphate-dependent enzyme [Solirubrobacter deserti]